MRRSSLGPVKNRNTGCSLLQSEPSLKLEHRIFQDVLHKKITITGADVFLNTHCIASWRPEYSAVTIGASSTSGITDMMGYSYGQSYDDLWVDTFTAVDTM